MLTKLRLVSQTGTLKMLQGSSALKCGYVCRSLPCERGIEGSFIYGLVYDAVRISEYVVPNGRASGQ
jgi:hypothetical protein